jgi:hypothetical protein
MPVDIATVVVGVCSWGATYLVHSSCLLAGLWVFLKIHPAMGHVLREALWKAALVGGVVTTSLQMLLSPPGPFGGFTLAFEAFRPIAAAESTASIELPATRHIAIPEQPGTMASPDVSAEAFATGVNREIWTETGSLPDGLLKSAPGFESANRSHSKVLATRGSSQPTSGGAIRQTWTATAGFFITAALAAIMLGVARCAWQTVTLRRRLARCTAIEEGPARRLLDELCRFVPRSPEVHLLAAADDPEPSAFGIRRWTIVLPHRAVRDLAEDELRALLAHELAHLVRGDSIWLGISRLICSCLAFQPLNHLARREWQRAAEILCDHWAVGRTGTPLALARCLTVVAGWRLSGRASAALLAATGRKSGLADRIERLVEGDGHQEGPIEFRRRRHLYMASGIVLGLVTCCTPRVQLAGAAAAVTQTAQDESGREEDSALISVEDNQEGTGSATDGAKPQANGESDSRNESLLDAPAAGSPVASARDVSREAAPDDIAALLKQLDSDLRDLERELAGLEALLNDHPAPPVARLAKQLRVEIGRLKQRRQILQVKSKTASKIAHKD